jgi:SAM-dependent methyltransferase
MRWILAITVFGACAHAPPVLPKASLPSERAIRDKSHDILAAFDRGDVAAVGAALAPDFVHFDGGEPTTRSDELASLAKRKPDEPRIGSRTWNKEFVHVYPDRAVFVGEASEHMAGNDIHGGYNFDGWYTLEWRLEGGAWRLALSTWKRGGPAEKRDAWNEIFRNAIGFDKQPNRLLVDTVAGMKPGRALDVAMGQGRNALYLASQHWTVTGVDFSDEGLRAARATAASQHLALDAVFADLDTYDFGVDTWDLVTLIYAGDDPKWIDKIKRSLKRGGVLVVEYFHDNDQAGIVDGSFARGELATLLGDGFEIVRDDIVDGVPDWAMDHATLVRFVARKR